MRWFPVLFIVLDVLLASVSCFNIECEFAVQDWRYGINGNACVTKNVVVQAPKQIVTSINGQTKFHSHDVKMIDIDSQTLHYLPRGFEKFFLNIQAIHYSHSKLKSINKYDLKQFPNLKYIAVHYNDLETIDADLFEFTPDVSFVYFNHNNLKTVGTNVISKLEKLTEAHFSSCGCINKVAQSRSAVMDLMDELKEKCPAPEDLKEKYCGKDLEELHTEITELKSENKELKAELDALKKMINNLIFEGLNSLKRLSLQNNELKFLSPNLSSQLAKLSSTDFTINVCIKEIKAEAIFENCIASVDLQCYFGDDKIFLDENSSIEGYMCRAHDLFVDYPASRIAKLSGTHTINKDADSVTAFVSIEQSMSFIPLDLAERLPNLEIVVIDKSGLTSLQRNDFKKMRLLKQIVIRHNNLTSIDEGTFDDNEKISHLDLSDNGIVSLPSKVFSKLVNLETLLLMNNQIKKLSSDLLPLKNLIKEFRVNANQIEIVDTRVLRTLINSQIIDFTGNTCTDKKFDKSDKSGPTFNELFFEINFKCCGDCD